MAIGDMQPQVPPLCLTWKNIVIHCCVDRRSISWKLCWRAVEAIISSQRRHVLTIGKNLLSSIMSSTCPHNMVNFGLLVTEIGWPVWGTPPNFNRLRVLAALLHSSKLVTVSQTLLRWTRAPYVWQGDHHIGHWPTFLVNIILINSND